MRQISNSTRDLQAVREALATATQHASTAMRKWTGGQLKLSLEDHQEISVEDFSSSLEMDSEPRTIVLVGVDGFESSRFLLQFDSIHGRQLVACLLHRPVNESAEWSQLEESALNETANILVSAYLNELSFGLVRPLRPTPPLFLQDFSASVLQQIVMMQAQSSERLLLCRTKFELQGVELDWSVYFLPGEDLLQVIDEATH